MEHGLVLHGAGFLEAARAMQEIADVGFKHFEWTHGHVRILEEGNEASFRDALEHARTLGLNPAQLHGPSLEPGFDLASPDPQVRERSVKRSCLWVQHSSRLGVPVMVEHGCEFHEDFETTMHLMKQSFKTIAKCASEVGVRVAVENEFDPRGLAAPAPGGRNMVVPARVGCLVSELKELVEDVDPESLGICLDFGHANLQRPLFALEEAIREGGSSIIATHLHDNEGLDDQHMLPLMGSIPWDRAMGALADIGYSSPVILEIGGLPRDDRVRHNRLRLYKAVASEICGPP